MIYDVVIIGAGAAGLAAAYNAAKDSQLSILVLEKEKLPGRKLSAAGNGRCNLTNRSFDCSCYHSESQDLLSDWIECHSYKEILAFFDAIGIPLYETNGYFYPLSNQGRQVTELLYLRCREKGVHFAFEQRVKELSPPLFTEGQKPEVYEENKNKSLYHILATNKEGEEITYQALRVILATGGRAAPKLGGSDSSERLLKNFQLEWEQSYSALSPIYVDDSSLKLAKGVRLDAFVTLNTERFGKIKERGQVQINENRLSGIVVMNMSCYYNREQALEARHNKEKQIAGSQKKHKPPAEDKYDLYLDVFPDISWDGLRDYISVQRENFPEETVFFLLKGILPEGFADYITKRLGYTRDMTVSELGEKQLNRLVSTLKKLTFRAIYTEDYERAQTTGGGVALSEVDVKGFQSIHYPGLYIVGEALDICGKCGGYNLTFAILSGIAAANAIVKG
ncbi:MAG: aminoacetone oxidase family FAD-binding enzyme [Lachnospiraceae bacterium]|nr:aminoacetone oxidase family FAD-binding enzyme [Lachnospiraceae bacterium]